MPDINESILREVEISGLEQIQSSSGFFDKPKLAGLSPEIPTVTDTTVYRIPPKLAVSITVEIEGIISCKKGLKHYPNGVWDVENYEGPATFLVICGAIINEDGDVEMADVDRVVIQLNEGFWSS
jgi:hypothetical protein